MRCGGRSSRLSQNDAACSSRAPKVASEHLGPCRPLRPGPQDGGEVAGPSGVSGGMPPRHGVQVFSASALAMVSPPDGWLAAADGLLRASGGHRRYPQAARGGAARRPDGTAGARSDRAGRPSRGSTAPAPGCCTRQVGPEPRRDVGRPRRRPFLPPLLPRRRRLPRAAPSDPPEYRSSLPPSLPSPAPGPEPRGVTPGGRASHTIALRRPRPAPG
jgi:hypothetical protein